MVTERSVEVKGAAEQARSCSSALSILIQLFQHTPTLTLTQSFITSFIHHFRFPFPLLLAYSTKFADRRKIRRENFGRMPLQTHNRGSHEKESHTHTNTHTQNHHTCGAVRERKERGKESRKASTTRKRRGSSKSGEREN